MRSATATFAVVTGGGTAGPRAAGAGDRRGAGRRRPRAVRRSTTSAPRAASRRRCCRPRRSRTRSSTSSGCSARSTCPTSAATPASCPSWRRRRRAAVRLLRELRPRVVVSVGGYASIPAVLAARGSGSRRRRQLRPASRAGQRAGGAHRAPPRPSPSPTRRCRGPSSPAPRCAGACSTSTAAVTASDARQRLGLPADRFVVAVMGGSQGSGCSTPPSSRYVAEHADDAGAGRPPGRRRALPGRRHRPCDGTPAWCTRSSATTSGSSDAVRRRRPARRARRGQHRRRGRRHRHSGDPRAVVGRRPRTTRRPTCAGWPTRAGRSCCPRTQLAELGDQIERLRADDDARQQLGARAAGAGEQHRSGTLAELVERVAEGAAGMPGRGGRTS